MGERTDKATRSHWCHQKAANIMISRGQIDLENNLRDNPRQNKTRRSKIAPPPPEEQTSQHRQDQAQSPASLTPPKG